MNTRNTRPIAFVLTATHHGSLIVNRHDYCVTDDNMAYGVGHQLMINSCFDPNEVDAISVLLQARRDAHGDGVIAIDCGANIGVHTVEWAKLMHGWGEVVAFEAQERTFYALAGNIALNNCFNASVNHAAVGEQVGTILVPQLDYLQPASFGSLEIKPRPDGEDIGQSVSYQQQDCKPVSLISIDSLSAQRVDLIKIDVEGMEMDVLNGAKKTIDRCQPVLHIEACKSDRDKIIELLQTFGYRYYSVGINLLAVHSQDPINKIVSFEWVQEGNG
ncbi:FkbM family methyltransferase [Saccharobesus litoralis]|uniref:FkbM family methyltransferase n=1 Tax=Saccharobesus litoralis TaxID=2172099 RepID=A0A2S0VN29_9ALTE|nr:FkbM family methyltransferase [Saccharobesus litoralis]AWB65631.1 FkbM family methyltransferase [Saccharobesus litoralis]